MSLDMENPVRVKMVDGENYVGYIKDINEVGVELQCTYKFVDQATQDDFEEKVMETLMDLDTRSLLAVATEMGILRKCLTVMGFKTRWSDFSGGVGYAREQGLGGKDSLKVGRGMLVHEQKKGLCSVIGTAMMGEMEPVLVPLQSPVSVIVANGAWESISSLIDEGQEKLFERWAQGL